MATPRKYAGEPVINARYGYKTMHWLAQYSMYNINDLAIYSDAFDEVIKIIVKRYKMKLQTVIGIVGATGSAKSTLAIQMCIEIAKQLHLAFDLEKDYIYSAKDVWDKLESDDFSPICLYDEASVSLNSKRAMSRENIDLENAFTTLRDRGMISILCVPTLDFIDKAVRDVHLEYVINVYDERNPLIRGYGKGFFDFNDRRYSRRSKRIYWNVLFAGVFEDLDEETKKIYLPIKRKHQDDLIKESKQRYYNAGN